MREHKTYFTEQGRASPGRKTREGNRRCGAQVRSVIPSTDSGLR